MANMLVNNWLPHAFIELHNVLFELCFHYQHHHVLTVFWSTSTWVKMFGALTFFFTYLLLSWFVLSASLYFLELTKSRLVYLLDTAENVLRKTSKNKKWRLNFWKKKTLRVDRLSVCRLVKDNLIIQFPQFDHSYRCILLYSGVF